MTTWKNFTSVLWRCFGTCLKIPDDEFITELDYSNGTLTTVPPEVSKYGRTLEELDLSSNEITDLPPELFYCEGLRVLKLNGNELDLIPSAIGSLTQLIHLDLSQNAALATIPDTLKNCKNLQYLNLTGSNLKRVPDAITNLISLKELYLNDTSLEFLPANFGRLVNLRILELRSNHLMTLPRSMGRLQELIRLDIGTNEFTELPEVVGNLCQLEELWIDCNRIRRILPNIRNLRSLIHLEANGNRIRYLPNEIASWENIEALSLSHNELQALPAAIGDLKRLITLKLDANCLQALPESIGEALMLEELLIQRNFILELPATIGMLRKLRCLLADENLLTQLPKEISSCISLTVLSLRGNQICELPSDIGHLKCLRVMNMVNNHLRNLPISVQDLGNLQALWLSENQSRPMITLQLSDRELSPALTCYMLPQSIWRSVDSPYDISVMLEEREPAGAQSNPSKKICFAETTPQSKKEGSTVSSRLLRSPTPYPKELRKMAKYVERTSARVLVDDRTQPAAAGYIDNSSSVITPTPPPPPPPKPRRQPESPMISPLSIKEAKVLQNPQAGTPSVHRRNTNGKPKAPRPRPLPLPPDELYSSPGDRIYPFQRASNDEINGQESLVPQMQQSLGVASSSYKNLDMIHENDDYYDAYVVLDREGNIIKPPSSVSRSRTPTPCPSIVGVEEKTHAIYRHYYQQQQLSPQLRSPQPIYYPNPTDEAVYVAPADLKQQQQRRPDAPPPYHVAKAYTKKSPEDLLTYEAVRLQNQLTEISENVKNNLREEMLPRPPSSFDDNCSPDDNNSSSNYNSTPPEINSNSASASWKYDASINNNVESTSNKFVPTGDDDDGDAREDNNCNLRNYVAKTDDTPAENFATLGVQDAIQNIQESPQQSAVESINEAEYLPMKPIPKVLEAVNPIEPTHTGGGQQRSMPWLFGPHRNPTVKQFTIPKDIPLGFEVKEVPNQGIFVSIIQTRSNASNVLCVDDKILDVDGVDFSKISLPEAVNVLLNSGPVLTIIISRM